MNSKWIGLGFKIVAFIPAIVDTVEKFIAGKGKAKQDAAMDMLGVFITSVEGVVGKELLDEAKVQNALRKVIDAVVAFQNVVADVKAKKQ